MRHQTWRWPATMIVGAVITIAGASAALAQHPQAPVGFQIGYSRADLGGPNGERLSSRQGALAGVYLTGRLQPWLAVQPELLFAVKGGRTVADVGDGDPVPLDIELAYLEMPVLLKFSGFIGRGRVHPVLFTGVAPAVRVGCDLRLTIDNELNQVACEALEDVSFERIDFGGVVGGGVQLDLAETMLALEARYTVGVSTIFDGPLDVRNRQLGILLALSF